jgi:hypothetical protein
VGPLERALAVAEVGGPSLGVALGGALGPAVEAELGATLGTALGVSEKGLSPKAGLLVGFQVGISNPELLLCIRSMERVVTTEAAATTAMITWVAVDIPTVPVAAVASAPAPVAADVPADAAAWTAIA